MMEEEPFPWPKDNHIFSIGSDKEEARCQDRADKAGLSSTTANMDRYDYMNMLAEARIVDIAWIY